MSYANRIESTNGNSTSKVDPSSPNLYHEHAQAFINSSKALGYNVTAENGELIAHPPGTPGYVKPGIVTPPKPKPKIIQNQNNNDILAHEQNMFKSKSRSFGIGIK